MKIYRYLYYKLYCLWLKKKDEVRNAQINAVMTITFFIYLNLIDILTIYLAIFRKVTLKLPEVSTNVKIGICSIMISFGLLNYFLLAYKEKSQKIVEEFKNETERQRKRGTLYVLIYTIITIGIPFFIVFFVSRG